MLRSTALLPNAVSLYKESIELRMNTVITGASKGLGKALVLEALDKGHRVLALSRSNINIAHQNLQAVNCDLTLDESVNQFIEAVGNWGHPDNVVHNAGFLVKGDARQLHYSDYRQSFDTNFWAPYKLTTALLAQTEKAQQHIYIGSMGGVQGSLKFPGLSLYSTSKAAVAVLAEMMHAEFGGMGHTFNCLALGAVQTEMLEAAFPGYQAPIGPEEMARKIFQFAEMAVGAVSGQVISFTGSNPK